MKLALTDERYHFQDVEFSAMKLLTDCTSCWKMWDVGYGDRGWMKEALHG